MSRTSKILRIKRNPYITLHPEKAKTWCTKSWSKKKIDKSSNFWIFLITHLQHTFWSWLIRYVNIDGLAQTAVTPLLMHWSYCSLALNHRYEMHPASSGLQSRHNHDFITIFMQSWADNLEYMGQGQTSLCKTHLPSTDGRTDSWTDRQSETSIPLSISLVWSIPAKNSLSQMHLKMLFAKYQPFCSGLSASFLFA